MIEALAERIAESVLDREEVRATVIKVAKPTPPTDAELEMVQVEIHRSK